MAVCTTYPGQTTRSPAGQFRNGRQKAMMAMLPILALTLVVLLKNPLKPSSSSAETPSASVNAGTPLVDSDIEIPWEVPALLEAGGRDPMRPPSPPVVDVTEAPAVEPAASHAELVVTGILYSPDRPSALVDTHVVREGQRISGATVVKIDADGVEFEMNGRTWRQTVDRQ